MSNGRDSRDIIPFLLINIFITKLLERKSFLPSGGMAFFPFQPYFPLNLSKNSTNLKES